ncbi:membrane protein [Methylopila jiangsuensis]|uniref:Membrane protein n=1 Tax=Methylopila jiangsuensis TaxID=586230 RepID=A0A9W6JGA6_9HYPH|nr:putative sulfate exporter family transporter [Methylopila jiangsuensis]MDR6285737.1 putative integral membrane protein (TIGR00698 family) [Methylopila jiangsuensis]GLK75494.1 membrane protein [Methylopila jiangsuensis]
MALPIEPLQPLAPASGLARLAPGLAYAGAVAALAFALRELPGVGLVGPMSLAVGLGIAARALVGAPAAAGPGLAFALRPLLRLGVMLLGLQLTLSQAASIGAGGFAVIAVSLAGTFAFTLWAGRRLGVAPRLTQLIAAGTSVCGASAIVAANTVARADDEDVAYAIACVTLFGTLGMTLYPLLAGPFGLDAQAYGLWAGASLHEVAQAVGASTAGGPEAGEAGTVAKLSRVILLAPLVIGLGLWSARGTGREAGHPPAPWFVGGFLALIVLNSVVALPAEAKALAAQVATALLAVALAAMGLSADLAKLRARGARPLLLGLIATLFITAVSLGGVTLLG